MSHFTVLVLVPALLDGVARSPDALEARAADLLAPYNENTSVAPYKRKCSCVNRAAVIWANEEANKSVSLENLRTNFAKVHAAAIARRDVLAELSEPSSEERNEYKKIEKELQSSWRGPDFYGAFDARRNELLQQHPSFEKPDPECETCSGSGQHETEYNPKSKWDWHTLGGRWNGMLSRFLKTGAPKPDNANIVPLAHIDIENPDFGVFAVVTPDGEWHEQAEMLWFGMTTNDNDAWEQDMPVLLKQHEDCIGLLVDCHI